jgi:CsoR family transcriptional regulator, copper-sensing transcriptional repressor
MKTTTGYLDVDSRKRLLNRLSRIEGQIRALKAMVEEERCADDILVQGAAARGALGQFVAKMLEAHLADCVNNCMEGDRVQVSERLMKAVSAALKV